MNNTDRLIYTSNLVTRLWAPKTHLCPWGPQACPSGPATEKSMQHKSQQKNYSCHDRKAPVHQSPLCTGTSRPQIPISSSACGIHWIKSFIHNGPLHKTPPKRFTAKSLVLDTTVSTHQEVLWSQTQWGQSHPRWNQEFQNCFKMLIF